MARGGISDREAALIIDPAVTAEREQDAVAAGPLGNEVPHEVAYEYQRADGTVEHAASAEDAIARCPVLGELALKAPGQAEALLALATAPEQSVAGQPRPDESENRGKGAAAARSDERESTGWKWTGSVRAAIEKYAPTLPRPDEPEPLNPDQTGDGQVRAQLSGRPEEEVSWHASDNQAEQLIAAPQPERLAPRVEAGNGSPRSMSSDSVPAANRPASLPRPAQAPISAASPARRDSQGPVRTVAVVSRSPKPALKEAMTAAGSPDCEKDGRVEPAGPIPAPAPSKATSAPRVRKLNIKTDAPGYESTAVAEQRPTSMPDVAEPGAVVMAPDMALSPEPVWLEGEEESPMITVWPPADDAEISPAVSLALEGFDFAVAVEPHGHYVSLPEEPFESHGELAEAVEAEPRPAIEARLDGLEPERAGTVRELVADLTLMIKECRQLPEEAVEEREVLEQVINQLSVQLLDCIGENHDGEAVKRFIAGITRTTTSILPETDNPYHDEHYLNRMGTHEYKTLDQSSILGSLTGFIRQKLQLHLELARYGVRACLA